MTAKSEPEVLEMAVHIAAAPEIVFRYFTDPERFARWMGGAMGSARLDPRPGGEVGVDFPAFGDHPAVTVRGEVLEIEEPVRFVFTWGYQGDPDLPPGSTRVDITLQPAPDGTLLRLSHGGLPEGGAARHRGGWRIYTAMLASGAAEEALAARREPAVAAWFAAWAETDPTARREKLAASCAPDVTFRDQYAALVGVDDLAGHIGASQVYSAGVRLESDGPAAGTHDGILFAWRGVDGDEKIVARGYNTARLDLKGRLREVYGYRS